ncbi:LINE-1 retrotransposable element ORF2 protein [Cucumis melo var. makuwa]|uniref:LINE-1 retrotransposable element ORF2 protein n=1 Tax=Cucumis melo var. makuwa TaxID=1194695 RepID=A0A5A7SLC3_CUCMM|nr:LINE-1 retrotransposable element ORF2 protein [Cucumis melo var. makuwa]TYK00358.1 LINE-1 retrotransposable element ORF2 protein [Cucumis melo var. makuwa]
MATRLKTTLKETIAENQMDFVEGRQIIDAILIANEAICYWRVKKTKEFVLKLDIEKAFDTINLSFIDYIWRMKGYPKRWRKWIKACVSNVQ